MTQRERHTSDEGAARRSAAIRPEPVQPVPGERSRWDGGYQRASPAQRQEALARAVATPDICLIQGFPGTGKSRVIAEMILQAAGRGERVLFLAPTPAG